MAKKSQAVESTRGRLDPGIPPAPERIVGSGSLLARMLGIDRQTVNRLRDGGMPWHDKRSTKRGDDYSYDLAAIWEWRFADGERHGREQAAKSGAGVPAAPAGGWVHPTTGKMITDEDVILAEKRRVIAEANRTEHQEASAYVKRRRDENGVVEEEDAVASFTYLCKMMFAGLSKIAVRNRKEFEDLGMHPFEARAKAEEPVIAMLEILSAAKLLQDPTKEPIDEEPERDHVEAAGPADGDEEDVAGDLEIAEEADGD